MILAFLTSLVVYAELPVSFKTEIRHSRSALVYEWDGRVLSASDRAMKTSFELKKCNQKMLEDFFAIEKTHWKNRPATGPDSIRVKRNNENLLVSSRSALGQYLLTLKDQLLLLKAQESSECK